MENGTLTGTLVLVRPDPEYESGTQQGHIGVLTLARSEKENYVRFPEGGEAFYPASQVLMLKDKLAVFTDLTSNGSTMPLQDFKAMYKIMLLQDKGTSQSLYAALALANDYPGIRERVLEPIAPGRNQQVAKTVSR